MKIIRKYENNKKISVHIFKKIKKMNVQAKEVFSANKCVYQINFKMKLKSPKYINPWLVQEAL